MHNIKDRTIRQFLVLKMLSVLETKIDGNHLTATFSDKSEYASWVDEIEAATKAKMRYIEDYTGTIQHEAEGISDKEYEELLHAVITEVVSFMRSVMKAVITESCEEKLTFYKEVLQAKPSDEQIAKAKDLIARNEGYIKRLAEF
jgi:hypothetical protein